MNIIMKFNCFTAVRNGTIFTNKMWKWNDAFSKSACNRVMLNKYVIQEKLKVCQFIREEFCHRYIVWYCECVAGPVCVCVCLHAKNSFEC